MHRLHQIILLIAGILFTGSLHAGGGLFGAFFDGDHEFVCYNSIHRNFFLGIFGAVALAGIFAWSRFRFKNRSANELALKNQVIEEQNKDILDSIRYASRLQQALEPDKNALKSILPESFFLLKPRDIVGGDFYFVEECRGKVIVAAIDCTGHGVPGAFLTFIGHNALRNALDKSNSLDASGILEAMNHEVKRSLGQQRPQNELNDGMEVGLCVFDKSNGNLNYAGAGTSLYLLKGNAVTEVKAAKCSVGSIQDHVAAPPQSHHIVLDKGDSFFMSSDGITDQFGGPDGKKFQRERLRKLLEEVSHFQFSKQQEVIATRIAEWMKGHKQTDDMLLLGVRY